MSSAAVKPENTRTAVFLEPVTGLDYTREKKRFTTLRKQTVTHSDFVQVLLDCWRMKRRRKKPAK